RWKIEQNEDYAGVLACLYPIVNFGRRKRPSVIERAVLSFQSPAQTLRVKTHLAGIGFDQSWLWLQRTRALPDEVIDIGVIPQVTTDRKSALQPAKASRAVEVIEIETVKGNSRVHRQCVPFQHSGILRRTLSGNPKINHFVSQRFVQQGGPGFFLLHTLTERERISDRCTPGWPAESAATKTDILKIQIGLKPNCVVGMLYNKIRVGWNFKQQLRIRDKSI